MGFIGVLGKTRKEADNACLLLACNSIPSLILDAGNVSDPHTLMRFSSAENLKQVYGLHTDLLYVYRDMLRFIPDLVREKHIQCIVVTSTDHLFNYQDTEENADIRLHAFRQLEILSRSTSIFISLHPTSPDLHLARKFCEKIVRGGDIMGHTVRSQRQVIDALAAELKSYAKALRAEDQAVLHTLLQKPLKHIGSIGYASSLHTWAFFLLSIAMEQEKRIQVLEEELCRRGL